MGASAGDPAPPLSEIELVEKAHRRGLIVFTWTLNTEEDIKKAMEIGVDGFATDDPCFARKLSTS